MMWLTPEEAKKLVCPFFSWIPSQEFVPVAIPVYCLAERCMAWWQELDKVRGCCERMGGQKVV